MQLQFVFAAVCSLLVLPACLGQNPDIVHMEQNVLQAPGAQAVHAQQGHAGPPAAQAAPGQAAVPAQPGAQPAFHQGNLPDPNHATGHPREAANPLHNRDHVQDLEHLKHHLDPIVGKSTEEMTEDELQFHYFTQHDYDKNNKLDGIELVSAMTHFHEEDQSNSDHHDPALSEEEITSTIDQILRDDDRNRDGYIDYSEFKASQAK